MQQILKTLMRTSSNGIGLWRKQRSEGHVSILRDSAQFCLLLKEHRFQVLIVVFVFFWPRGKTNKEFHWNRECNGSFQNKQRTPLVLSIRGKVFKYDRSFSRTHLIRWHSSNNNSLISLLYKDMQNLKKSREFKYFYKCQNFADSKAHKYLENSYKLYILELFSIRSYLNFNLVCHSLSTKCKHNQTYLIKLGLYKYFCLRQGSLKFMCLSTCNFVWL